jgi:hypothetical protein
MWVVVIKFIIFYFSSGIFPLCGKCFMFLAQHVNYSDDAFAVQTVVSVN